MAVSLQSKEAVNDKTATLRQRAVLVPTPPIRAHEYRPKVPKNPAMMPNRADTHDTAPVACGWRPKRSIPMTTASTGRPGLDSWALGKRIISPTMAVVST